MVNLSTAYLYLGLSMLPCFHAFYSVPEISGCKALKNFLTTSSGFLLIQLPFWSCLPFLVSAQMANYRSTSIATFSFLSELPYFIVGCLFTYDGLQVFQVIEPESQLNITEACNSRAMTFYTVFVLFLTTMAFGSIWLMSVPYFVDTVYPNGYGRKYFVLISILTSIAILVSTTTAAKLTNNLSTCKHPIGFWMVASTVSLCLFFFLYFLVVSLEHLYLSETCTRYISNFLVGGFLPSNMLFFMKGMVWFAEEISTNDTEQLCIQQKAPVFILVLIYHTVLTYILFLIIISTYTAITSDVSPNNLLRPFQISNLESPVFQLNFLQQSQQSPPQYNIELVEKLKHKEFNTNEHSQSFNEKTVCPICMDGFSSGQLVIYLNPCRHVYHEACIKNWIIKNSSCPTCRRHISSEIFEQK